MLSITKKRNKEQKQKEEEKEERCVLFVCFFKQKPNLD